MASSAPFSPRPIYTHIHIIPPKTQKQKPFQNPNFLLSITQKQQSLSSSIFSPNYTSYPQTHISLRNDPSVATNSQLATLSDSKDVDFSDNCVDTEKPINGFVAIEPKESTRRVFIRDPPWITSLFVNSLYGRSRHGSKKELQEVDKKRCIDSKWKNIPFDDKVELNRFYLLRRRQIREETEAWEKMADEYRELQREMCEKKLAPSLPYVKKLFLGWFEPLRDAIEKVQKTLRTKKHKNAYAPFIDSLQADKMAIIVMHKMMALLMTGLEDRSVRVVQAATQIGVAVEHEVRIQSFLGKTKMYKSNKSIAFTEESVMKDAEILRKRVRNLIKKKKLIDVQKIVKTEEIKPWGREIQAKLGCRLIELLTDTAYVQPPIDQISDCPPDIRPAFRHLFKISNAFGRKTGKRYGYIECDPLVLAGLDRTVRHMIIPYVPMLVPPRRWKGHDKGGYLFLPSYLMRTHGSRQQRDAVKNVTTKQLQKVYEALDILGNTKWRINKRVLSVVESIWARGGNIAGLVDRKDIPILKRPESEDTMDIKRWRWGVKKAKKTNQELHSQRCDIELKLCVARKMKDEEGFYYPHNLDFRGRAYPMHPHLNHLSSDLCRGILEFAEGRPLGSNGLKWLKIHLANLYGGGVDKLSYDERLDFVEKNIDDVLDSGDNPLNGNQWWLKAEDPFQCLAACVNLSEALKSSSPQCVISHLPIHLDGSCNGLQHYAALGRDSSEAAAVNLIAREKPADVYSELAAKVQGIMRKDSNKDPETYPNAILAKILISQVDRKLVKQTVMTSVYGVTYLGAREQIKRRLAEKGQISDDSLLFTTSCYAAKVTMAALGELFKDARGIMSWLSDCAKIISAENQPVRWTTPLGLPVLQAYYKSKRQVIKTSLQVLALQCDSDNVDMRKQTTAFPPNFVHSLDGSHMMMTALACRDAGLRFAGVHDSFWTHACDVETLNHILREKFVELYTEPILENLLESFQTSYPELTFPPLPQRGDFDLQQVLQSPYFFN